VPSGGTRGFVIEGSTVPYILIHLETGEFKAYEQKCTHLSCSVFYKPGTGIIHCPCHEGSFDAKTGDVIAGPPPRALPNLDVFFKGNDIYVKAAEKVEYHG
jgi:Rieske Fe-S protein